jgi:hypothetical protein
MHQIMVTIQGQRCSPDVGLIRRLLSEHPDWGRSRLSVGLCELWDWRAANGQFKDMACRSLLLRLERAGAIRLPPRQHRAANWQLVGESTGRSRNDRQRRLRVPRKAVYLYPLSQRLRQYLCDDT